MHSMIIFSEWENQVLMNIVLSSLVFFFSHSFHFSFIFHGFGQVSDDCTCAIETRIFTSCARTHSFEYFWTVKWFYIKRMRLIDDKRSWCSTFSFPSFRKNQIEHLIYQTCYNKEKWDVKSVREPRQTITHWFDSSKLIGWWKIV